MRVPWHFSSFYFPRIGQGSGWGFSRRVPGDKKADSKIRIVSQDRIMAARTVRRPSLLLSPVLRPRHLRDPRRATARADGAAEKHLAVPQANMERVLAWQIAPLQRPGLNCLRGSASALSATISSTHLGLDILDPRDVIVRLLQVLYQAIPISPAQILARKLELF